MFDNIMIIIIVCFFVKKLVTMLDKIKINFMIKNLFIDIIKYYQNFEIQNYFVFQSYFNIFKMNDQTTNIMNQKDINPQFK